MLYILVIFKDWLLEDDKLVGVIVIFLVFLIGFEKRLWNIIGCKNCL